MFKDGFWSHDYSSGVEALISALNVSVAENKQFLAMVQERARIEHSMATSLAQLSQQPAMHAVPVQTGTFVSKSSSLQSALGAFTTETVNQAVFHTRIASSLDSSIRAPLQKWCRMYASRIDTCTARLSSLVAGYHRLLHNVNKQKVAYYENCQKFEDSASAGSPRDPIINTIRLLKDKWTTNMGSPERSVDPQRKPREFVIAGLRYSKRELADLLSLILADITLTEYKVPFLGAYENVCTGSMLSTAARKHLQNDSFAYAEKFGQSLVDLGFLKPVGQISNKYQSLHASYYQWQDLAFELIDSTNSISDTPESPRFDDSGFRSGSASASTSSSIERRSASASLLHEDNQPLTSKVLAANESSETITATDPSEEPYLQAVLELDKYRCDMELEMMETYEFLDNLEREREEAIKQSMEDFINIVYRPDEQEQMQTRLIHAQAQVDPSKDIDELVKKNRTGPFVPTVSVFRGYFNGNVVQTFGVDLYHSKFFVDLVLDWLNERPADEISNVSLWTHPEPIAEIYKLRSQINNGKPFLADSIFRFFSVSVIVSTFIQFLLELPESLVPFIVYERFKQLYSDSTPTREDIAVALVQIPQVNRGVLQTILKFLRRHYDPNEFAQLADSLALPIARPRAPSTVTMNDTHPSKLLADLLHHEPEIFEILDAKHESLKARKADLQQPTMFLRAAQQPDSPTPKGPSSTPTRIESSSGMRPLSLSFHTARGGSTNTSIAETSPSPTGTPNPPRGLGISPVLPISAAHQSSPQGSPMPSLSSPRVRAKQSDTRRHE